ncbi:hypothetical protein K438DRAFT_1741345, partial [Mycena galopus ATCC 62051]
MEHGGSAGGAVQGSERALTGCRQWNTAGQQEARCRGPNEHSRCRQWNTAGQQEARCRGPNEHSRPAGNGTWRVSRRRGAGVRMSTHALPAMEHGGSAGGAVQGVRTSTHVLPAMEHGGSAGGAVQGSERALTSYCRQWNTAGQQEARCRGPNEHSRPAGNGTRRVSRRRGAGGPNEHSRAAGDGTRRVSRRRGAGVRTSTH